MISTFKELRKQHFDYYYKKFPYLPDFIKNPYTFIKARFYIETSSVLVWFLLKTNIKPNTVTIIYGLAGIATGVLLAINNSYTICIGILIAFTKGTLDWSDGFLARTTGQTSLTGHFLDIYGAFLNSVGFQIGLGLFVAFNSDNIIFYYLVILLLFFRLCNLKQFCREYLYDEINNTNIASYIKSNKNSNNINPENTIINTKLKYLTKAKKLFHGFLDSRSRSVDFICLLIFLDYYYSFNLAWICFVIILIKHLLLFIVSFYKIGRGDWIESNLNEKIREIYLYIK